MAFSSQFDYEYIENKLQQFIVEYLEALNLDLDRAKYLTRHERDENLRLSQFEDGERIFAKYDMARIKEMILDGHKFPCNLLLDQCWKLRPDLYEELLDNIMFIEKRFIKFAKTHIPKLPSIFLQDLGKYLPFQQIPERSDSNDVGIWFSLKCTKFIVKITKARIEDIESIIVWLKKQQDESELDESPSEKTNETKQPDIDRKSYPLRDIPIENLWIVIIEEADGKRKINIFAEGKDPELITIAEAGLAKRYKPNSFTGPGNTLFYIASKNGGTIKLNKNKVSNLNRELKRILEINYRPIICKEKDIYEVKFKCRISR